MWEYADHFVYGPIRLGMDIYEQLPDQLAQVIVNKTSDHETATMRADRLLIIFIPVKKQHFNNDMAYIMQVWYIFKFFLLF